ncbi:MAG TPA: DUF6285 domain-containing protein [Dehalococcoidia bacterium]|nr:DUF6285 domain-containing protein [Dehalococcoidia bacterium]
MQDRPTYDELLSAIETFLDKEIVPNVPGSRGFHARVAANALRIVRRELEHREGQLVTEWQGLDELLGREERPPTLEALVKALHDRNKRLAERIRGGEADEGGFAERVREHVTRTVAEKLRVSDPGLLERSETP